MELIYNGQYFVAMSAYEERLIPKEAGFIWNKLVPKRWATADPEAAQKLAEYADAKCAAALLKQLESRQEAVAESMKLDSEIDIPANPGCEYRGYQKACVEYILSHEDTLIADPMGVGKTIEALAVANYLSNWMKKILIVTKASAKENWRRECVKWLVNKPSVGIVYSDNGFVDTDVVIINYELLKRYDELVKIHWDLFIIDESHYLNNRKTQRSQAVYGGKTRGPIRAKLKLAMTGTPSTRPKQLFAILQYLKPKLFPKWGKYAWRYCAPFHNGFGWDFSGSSNEEELNRILRENVMIRRKKKEVMPELPAKERQVYVISPGKKLGGQLKSKLNDFMQQEREIFKLREALKKTKDVEKFNDILKQLNYYDRLKFEESAAERREVGLQKIPFCIEYLREMAEESGHKMIVFGHHREVLQRYYQEFKDKALLVTGDVPAKKRQLIIDQFWNDPEKIFFFGSMMACGEAINLEVSAHVIFVEEDWEPKTILQCEDRAHRGEQKRGVLVTHLVLDESVDAYMSHITVEKQKVMDKVFNSEPSLSTQTIDTSNWGIKAREKQTKKETNEPCPF
jgi:SWI/SNF-related matrix-associated actin-dependent regulator 1 of chromatin subfamily A